VSSWAGVARASLSFPLLTLSLACQVTDAELFARRLLAPKNPLLTQLGARFPFEVAVGMNGRVWVKAAQEDDEDQLVDVIRELRGR